MTVMSVRELSHNTSAVMERVAHGETIEIAKRGKVIAVIHPVDARRSAYDELVAAGVVTPASEPGASVLERLGPPLPARPGRPTLSETLERMREEERY
jgi:prevent-host-death family protein